MANAVSNQASNQAIVDRMLSYVRGDAQKNNACSGDFTFDDFAVSYPSHELIASVEITRIPKGATLLGVTVLAAPNPFSAATYCMAVTADSGGLALPVSLLAATRSVAFAGPTRVAGMIILSYSLPGSGEQECTIIRQFTVAP
jgi:hypothetical protein